MKNIIETILTEDGSHSLFHKELGETYHSVHGAIQESEHVFIKTGFHEAAVRFGTIALLEVGFGTGLNALLTLNEAITGNLSVRYTALEPFPISLELAEILNYTHLVGDAEHRASFLKMHNSAFGQKLALNQVFIFEKHKTKVQNFNAEQDSFNLVYYDAFSPDKVPEMWEFPVFRRIYDLMMPGGILVTYCAKGSVRRAMQQAGFSVERLPGPPGKREILRSTVVKS